MSEYSSFFNSVVDGAGIYDREYNAEDFAEYFASFIGNGVYADRASELQVSAYGGNMSVIVPTGSAWINGYYYKNASDKNLTLTIADGALNRTDLIVVRLDLLERQITAEIVEGIPDTQGTMPELTRDADIWEIALASVSVPANATEISQANITDLRSNNEYCGWVSGVIDQIDTTGLFAQFTDEFNTWFDRMKGQLSTDAAGHLQQEIDDLDSDINTAIGSTDISVIGDGTVTGAVSALNNGLTPEIVKVTSDLISGDITFIKSGKVVTVNFFNDTKAAVPAWGESKLCAIPNGMLPAFDNEWNHGTITIQDGITTILVAYVDGIYVENKTSQTIGRGSWISGRLTYICE